MANIQNTSAMKALNEKDYINKLYDSNSKVQKELLDANYKDNSGVLNTEQQTVQTQAAENVDRTQVEANKYQSLYNGPKLSAGTTQQEALVRDNAQRQNVTELQNRQTQAEMEIERQRQLLASQYSAAIQQAQADNDMLKAQQLYNAAKAEEEQLLQLQLQAAGLLASVGDTSLQDRLMAGKTPTASFTGKTWSQVLKNEKSLNEIFDKQLESERLGLQVENEAAMSDLSTERQKQADKTDDDLTRAYVDALIKAKNYAEVQNSYGQGSGAANAARLARDTELQKALTGLRAGQMDTDLSMGIKGFDIGKEYRKAVAAKTADINKERADKLFEAADKEEQKLVNLQMQMGQMLAEQGDYSMLGLLYGLSQDQIDLLMGNVGGGYDSGGGGGSTDANYYKNWSNQTLQNMANAGVALYEANKTASGGAPAGTATYQNGKKYIQ